MALWLFAARLAMLLQMKNKIAQLRRARGLTQEELSDKLGMHWTTLSRIENDKTDPGAKRFEQIAAALDVDLPRLFADPVAASPSALPLTVEERGNASESAKRPGRRPTPNASHPLQIPGFSQTESVPLLGQAVGGPNGRFFLNGEQVGRLFCPPGLEGVEGAYAVLVYGTSMEPKFEAGETVWVNPKVPIRRNDYVIAQIGTDEENGFEAYIKQFVAWNSSVLRLRQFNPDGGEKEELEFDAEAVHSVHKIVFHALV